MATLTGDRATCKDSVKDLIDRYQDVLKKGKKSEYGEADVGTKFILGLLKALGWDANNIDEVEEQRTVQSGRIDYLLKLMGRPKIVWEIKGFDENLDGSRPYRGEKQTFPEQALMYAWHFRIDWAVLSNFEETRLYFAHVTKPEDGLVFSIRFDDYTKESVFSKLWMLSKESVVLGGLDRYERRRERREIDEEVLKDLIESRQMMISSLIKNNAGIGYDEANESAQKILNRLIFIRSCEDRLIGPSEGLKSQFENWQTHALNKTIRTFMKDLHTIFRDYDSVHDSSLFAPHFCEDLRIDNFVLENTIERLYKYNFDWIPVDVLGNAYELYIGSVIKEREGAIRSEDITLVEDAGTRKRHGIYYTPIPIVDFIVENTLKTVLRKCQNAEQVSKIRIADPACGSGSFLIRAYDCFFDEYRKRLEEQRSQAYSSLLEASLERRYIHEIKKKILVQNLYGVDLDAQAIDVVMVNLGLKAVEAGEPLPYMSDYVRRGNSIVGLQDSKSNVTLKFDQIFRLRDDVRSLELQITRSDDPRERRRLREDRDSKILEEEKGKESALSVLNEQIGEIVPFDDVPSKHPFHWSLEFPEVFQEGGFDIVIANPPYFNIQTIKDELEKEWLRKSFPEVFSGESDVHYFFYARGIQILREGGSLGFISSRYFMEAVQAESFRRYLQENTKLSLIIDFGSVFKVFRDATINTVVTILEKCSVPIEREKNQIRVVKVSDWSSGLDSLLTHIQSHLSEVEYHDSSISIYSVPQSRLVSSPWSLGSVSIEDIIDKVRAKGPPLSKFCDAFKSIESGLDRITKAHLKIVKERGIIANPPFMEGEEVFRVSEETVAKENLERSVCRPLLKNQAIRRYFLDWTGEFLLFLTNDTEIAQYPNVLRHLTRYKPLLEDRFDVKKGGASWYALSNPRNIEKITSKKDRLVTPYYSPENRFAFLSGNDSWVYTTDTHVVMPKDDCPLDLKYILGIVNSRLFEFIHKNTAKAVDGAAMTSKGSSGMRFAYWPEYILSYPIIEPKDGTQLGISREIVSLVERLIDTCREWKTVTVDFDQYLTEPLLGSRVFNSYFQELKSEDRKISDPKSKGKIRGVIVEEMGEWLVLKADFIPDKGEKKLLENHEVLRCRFSDESLRVFIYSILMKSERRIWSGNLMKHVLGIEIPSFVYDPKENLRIIRNLMEPYIKAVKSKKGLQEEITRLSDELDEHIYTLYDIEPAEIATIEGK